MKYFFKWHRLFGLKEIFQRFLFSIKSFSTDNIGLRSSIDLKGVQNNKMKDKNKELNICAKNIHIKKEGVIKKSNDYCIINGEKIEGNACSTILHNQ